MIPFLCISQQESELIISYYDRYGQSNLKHNRNALIPNNAYEVFIKSASNSIASIKILGDDSILSQESNIGHAEVIMTL